MLGIARRDFTAALAHPDVVVEGRTRELWAARGKGWVSDAELLELNRLLARINGLLRRPRGRGRQRLVSVCYVLAPIAPQPKRRAKKS
jgi:hypothetical protein